MTTQSPFKTAAQLAMERYDLVTPRWQDIAFKVPFAKKIGLQLEHTTMGACDVVKVRDMPGLFYSRPTNKETRSSLVAAGCFLVVIVNPRATAWVGKLGERELNMVFEKAASESKNLKDAASLAGLDEDMYIMKSHSQAFASFFEKYAETARDETKW